MLCLKDLCVECYIKETVYVLVVFGMRVIVAPIPAFFFGEEGDACVVYHFIVQVQDAADDTVSTSFIDRYFPFDLFF